MLIDFPPFTTLYRYVRNKVSRIKTRSQLIRFMKAAIGVSIAHDRGRMSDSSSFLEKVISEHETRSGMLP